ncbi:MAG: hypothetical protein FIA95_16425, partial [Gemmatimonadetes bacterium]|nr:hypothetical protein [Gemmatimonadota bacterium]
MTAAMARDRGGFALALVVLMLFAIAVAGATGYQVVSSEFTLAQQNRDGQEALAVARAGLQRFVGEQVGTLGDSVAYAIGDGIATVTARRVYSPDASGHLYYVRSVGEVADARMPLLPATRTVGTYVWHRLAPIPQRGPLWVSGGTTTFSGSATVSGADMAGAGLCPGSGPKVGFLRGGSVSPTPSGGAYVSGSPPSVSFGSYAAFYDSVKVRWDALSDSNFPVDFEDYFPNFATLPADSFPTVRFNGNRTLSWTSGRGVLIVTGRLTLSWFFDWDGIILAGSLGDVASFSAPPSRGCSSEGAAAPTRTYASARAPTATTPARRTRPTGRSRTSRSCPTPWSRSTGSGRALQHRDLLPRLPGDAGGEVLDLVHGLEHDRVVQALGIERGELRGQGDHLGAVVQIPAELLRAQLPAGRRGG